MTPQGPSQASIPVPVKAIIVGGGVAGAAAAITLAQRGRPALLLEREAAVQHKVCGEFLSQEALRYLRKLGVEPAALGALPLHSVRLSAGRRTWEARLPFAAMSLTRRALDHALLERARTLGVDVRCGMQVESLTDTRGEWCAQTADGQRWGAPAAMLATGKHDLRGHARPPGVQSGLIAFKMYWRLAASQAVALAGYVELALYRGGYAGLQMVEGGMANLSCLVEAREYKRLCGSGGSGGSWEALLAEIRRQSPHLAARLYGAEPLLDRPLAIASLPYGFVRCATDTLWHLGDQAAVIPSFTGDGISLALHTGVLAATMHADGHSAGAFQRRVASQTGRQVRLATHLSQALVRWPRAASCAAGYWPGILRGIARSTRIPPQHLLA